MKRLKKPKRKKECEHKNIRRFYQYAGGDCYAYTKRCTDCGRESLGWSREEAEMGDLK